MSSCMFLELISVCFLVSSSAHEIMSNAASMRSLMAASHHSSCLFDCPSRFVFEDAAKLCDSENCPRAHTRQPQAVSAEAPQKARLPKPESGSQACEKVASESLKLHRMFASEGGVNVVVVARLEEAVRTMRAEQMILVLGARVCFQILELLHSKQDQIASNAAGCVNSV